MQLIAYGAQDVYLTGNPQITFFKTIYRRHTNFAIETIEHQLTGHIEFNNRVSLTIKRNADLMTKVYLKVILGSVNGAGNNFAWVRRIGHAIIRQIEAEIGGTKIDTQYGVWIDIWYELARHGDHEIGYNKLIGDVPELTNYDSVTKPQYTLFIPLQFWFNRYIGLAIPLIALQYHDVRIHVEFESLEKLIIRDCKFDTTLPSLVDATLLIDYVYLDSDERRRFAQVGHEYLIEQLQWNGKEPVQNLISRYKLDYNHPCKEIIWAMNMGSYISNESFIYYTNQDVWSVEDAATLIINHSISIRTDPTASVGGTWSIVEPNSFLTIGTLNVTNDTLVPIYVNGESLKIGDYGITNKINADITVNADNTITIENVVTVLTVRDLSFPISRMTDTRINVCDPIINMFGNYGLLIDGSVNPVDSALIQMNGHDRFDTREGRYFNYVQPSVHHSNTPVPGINVYSFALFPEEHQPSGTANLSRIDDTVLTIWFSDSTFRSTAPDLQILNSENVLWVFAVNYNILRFLSGMSGLAYSA